MNNLVKFVSVILIFAFSTISYAEEIKPHPVSHLYSESLAQHDNKVEMTGLLIYPNGCYEEVKNDALIDLPTKIIFLNHMTKIAAKNCTFALVKGHGQFSFEKPPTGSYQIKDAVSGYTFGNLMVSDSGQVKFFESIN